MKRKVNRMRRGPGEREKRRKGETENFPDSPIHRFTVSPIHLQAGFTLIELMIVIVILAILATIVVPRFMGREEEAKRTAAMIQIKNFEAGLKLFKLDNGFYPSTEQGLKSLVEKPTTGREAGNWKEGGYLEAKEVPLDPWRNPYVYLSPGTHNKEYDIVSYGADGEEGGEGNDTDIQSWALER